jgi:Secretion system C-terminal sorting domain
MKNALKLLLIIALLSLTFLFAGMQMSELLFIPWGEHKNEVMHTSYPGLHTGPLSFQVENNDIIIFDTENKKLKTYHSNGTVSSEDLADPFVLDFYKKDGALYLLKPQHITVKENGVVRTIAKLDDPKNMFSGLKVFKGDLRVSHNKGSIHCASLALNKSQTQNVSVTRTLPASLNVTIGTNSYSLNVPEIGSVEYIGSTPDHHHYIYVETITSHVPLAVQRNIYLINDQADILNVLHLPQQKFTYIFKEFILGDEGELYHMQSSKDGIHILKWVLTDDNEPEIYYPETFAETYHFNQFTEAEPEQGSLPSLSKSAASPVTRAEALTTADEYVTHIWNATSANIGVTTLVTTPSWIQIGQNQRVPYQWGGYSTIAQFDAGIAAGKLAGDITTGTTVDLNNAVGADCSGFVSVCWTSGRYSTASFYQVSTQLSSYNDLLPADATNKAGSHIRMVVEWTNDGKLVQIEETASGTPGWAARYYTWRLSDISEYVPIRYNLIQNSLVPRPTLLSVTSKADSISLNWTADESGVFTGYRVYRKANPDENYSAVTEVPKGIKTATVPQNKDLHYDYFVATYIASDSVNYNPSDIYSAKLANVGESVLIVDGFDRFSGSYGSPVHPFVRSTAKALDGWSIAYESCANDAVISGAVDLKDYKHVWWICGDESTVDETFNSIEQDSVESYLKHGGKLFVSGSEIAWDLDNKGSTADKVFIHDYLKTSYVSDDAGNYNIQGQAGTVFQFLSFSFSDDGSETDTYAEDYPDELSTSGGSQIVLKYGNNKTAAVAFTGTFPGGSLSGQVVTMGFPFEVITSEYSRYALAGEILRYMGFDIRTGIDRDIPVLASLHQNYPNPFNPSTTIEYSISEASNVDIRIFNMRGQEVAHLVQGFKSAGEHEHVFNGTNLPSGVYVYRLDINNEAIDAEKMILNK